MKVKDRVNTKKMEKYYKLLIFLSIWVWVLGMGMGFFEYLGMGFL